MTDTTQVEKVATFESEQTNWYVVRITLKSGEVRYLGVDNIGSYLAAYLPHAQFYQPADREQALTSKAVTFFQECGAEVHWCRVIVAAAEPQVIT